MEWAKWLYILGAALAGWLLYRSIRGNPQAYSRENINKSVYTLGILALILIAFIGLIILLLKN
jgi:biotin transporter BioY